MRVCIDTNVLLQLFGEKQAGRPIRDALLAGRIELALSNEMLFEYQETITRLSGAARWQQVERSRAGPSLMLSARPAVGILLTERRYFWTTRAGAAARN